MTEFYLLNEVISGIFRRSLGLFSCVNQAVLNVYVGVRFFSCSSLEVSVFSLNVQISFKIFFTTSQPVKLLHNFGPFFFKTPNSE